MIDFKELPSDGIKFEQLIREILIREGFETHWTGIGPDGGRDLIIIEKLAGPLSSRDRKWIISCKHFANSGKSVGREDLGNITEDCKAINAEGFILVCSTQPSAAVVTRLEEIKNNNNIITAFWDAIEIEKRLLNPNTFSLIHTFFSKSSANYNWKIYNAYSPSFWAANYKRYFFYLSSRDAHTYPNLKGIETIISIFEKVSLYESTEEYGYSHLLRVRAIYYDDKHCVHTVFLDYLYPRGDKKNILSPVNLQDQLFANFTRGDDDYINPPDWEVKYVEASFGSDHFHENHKDYYRPYMENFETGSARGKMLSDLAYYDRLLKK